MRYERSIEVPRPPAEVFAYLSDFSTTAEWDPGIEEARRLTPEPTAVGSRFEVLARFRGKPQRFEYVVTELDEGRRVVLRGDGEKAVSEDEIVVTEAPSGATVRYRADLRLKGVYRVAEPFLGKTFQRLGDDALEGLGRKLG